MVLRDERLSDEQRQAYAKRLITDDPQVRAARARLRLLIGAGLTAVALGMLGLWVLGRTLDASLEHLDQALQVQRGREAKESREADDDGVDVVDVVDVDGSAGAGATATAASVTEPATPDAIDAVDAPAAPDQP